MQKKITTFLTFDGQAEEAVGFYTSAFANSRILSSTRYEAGGPGPEGELMSATFELAGQEFMALNGGPSFSFSGHLALRRLRGSGGGRRALGEAPGRGRAGALWLAHRPLWRLLADHPSRARRAARRRGSGEGRVMQAMLQMSKIEIDGLRLAYEGTRSS